MFGRRPGAPCSDTANTSVPWKEALQDTIRLYPSPGDCLRVHSKSLIVAALVMRTSNDRWTSPDPDDGFKEMDEKSGRRGHRVLVPLGRDDSSASSTVA